MGKMNTLLVLLVLTACTMSLCSAHMFVLGSRGGVTPNDNSVNFFSVNGVGPCGGIANSQAQYLNVTAGDVFTFSWSLVVNHNIAPAAPGSVSFGFVPGSISANSKASPVAPSVTITDQPISHYYPVSIVVPSPTGSGTIQIAYNVNGASSPYPIYYQCIDLAISAPSS